MESWELVLYGTRKSPENDKPTNTNKPYVPLDNEHGIENIEHNAIDGTETSWKNDPQVLLVMTFFHFIIVIIIIIIILIKW